MCHSVVWCQHRRHERRLQSSQPIDWATTISASRDRGEIPKRELSPEENRRLERFSSEFRERQIRTGSKDDPVAVDAFFVGILIGVGELLSLTVGVGLSQHL